MGSAFCVQMPISAVAFHVTGGVERAGHVNVRMSVFDGATP
jgi:hypothetical protein